jgi:hypothetical protein
VLQSSLAELVVSFRRAYYEQAMIDKRRKWMIVLGGALLALLLCIAGAIGIGVNYQKMTSCYNERPPLRSFVLTVDRSRQTQLIEQSRKFAGENGFKFQIGYYIPDHQGFLIDMTRRDAEILIGNTSIDLDSYLFSINNNDCFHPIVASDVDGLFTNLKTTVGEIPGASISEEK